MRIGQTTNQKVGSSSLPGCINSFNELRAAARLPFPVFCAYSVPTSKWRIAVAHIDYACLGISESVVIPQKYLSVELNIARSIGHVRTLQVGGAYDSSGLLTPLPPLFRTCV